jgi:hypothetical protein
MSKLALHSVNSLAFLRSLVKNRPLPTVDNRPPPLVTLSRDYGAQGERIAERLAARLGVEVHDHSLIDAVARHSGSDPRLMAELDEKVAHLRDAWVLALLTNQPILNQTYRSHLVNILLALTETGGVIVGRGAHVVLAGKAVLRVRIVGSLEACARRVAEDEKISLEEARRKVEDTNHERSRFVWEQFHSRLNEAVNFDLILNTDHIPADAAVELVLAAMAARGLVTAPR